MKISIINGPNLNLLGSREPQIYGNTSFDSFFTTLQQRFHNVSLSSFQSNIEGALIDELHRNRKDGIQGIVLNAGAYTHTSIALADAIAAIGLPVIEVHISNVMAREEFRKTSYIASKCRGSISGLGLEGYALAIQYLISTNPVHAGA